MLLVLCWSFYLGCTGLARISRPFSSAWIRACYDQHYPFCCHCGVRYSRSLRKPLPPPQSAYSYKGAKATRPRAHSPGIEILTLACSCARRSMKEFQFSRPPDGDRSQGWAILAVCWAFLTAAFATTVLRVWVRVRLTRNLGWDDYNMMIAMVSILPC